MEMEIKINEKTKEPCILIKTEGWEELPPAAQAVMSRIGDIQAVMYLLSKHGLLGDIDQRKYDTMLVFLLRKLRAAWAETQT